MHRIRALHPTLRRSTSLRDALGRPLARRARSAAALTLVAATVACDSPTVQPPEPVAAVAVAAEATALHVGDAIMVQATPMDAAGRPLTERAVHWSSSNETVAIVSSAGRVTGVGRGTARIGATSEGKRGEVVIEVSLPPVAAVTLGTNAAILRPGDVTQFIATPRDAQGRPIEGLTVVWSVVGDASAVSLSTTGAVLARRMGVATIRAAVGDHYAEALVTVLGTASHDLFFDRWAPAPDGIQRPWLHRLDMRTPGAAPVLVRGPMDMAPEVAPSPDGARIAFVCSTNGAAICIANADGNNGVLLPGFSAFSGGQRGFHGDQPAWSPDGSKIAFRGWSPGGPPGIFNPADIWVMNADGSNKVRLTTAVRDVDSYASPVWSPLPSGDGYRLAFVHETRSGGEVRASIESMRADGQDRRPVTAPGAHVDAEPTWSPDGGTIAFVRTGGTAAGDIWLARATGGDERPLMAAGIEPAGAQRAPAWSPDGGLIAFASNHEIIGTYVAYQIYTVQTDGTQLTRLTTDPAEKGDPSWIRR